MAEDPSLPPGFNADGSPVAVNKGGRRKDGTDWSTPRVTIPDSEFRREPWHSGRNGMAHARKDPNKTCGWKKRGRRPCRHWKGFRTDHPGHGLCYKHDQPSAHKHLLVQMAVEHWTANGRPGRKPVTPEAAASYLLSMWSDYVHKLDDSLGDWDDLSGNERQVLMSQLHVFSTDLSNLATSLLRLGFKSPIIGEEIAVFVVATLEATLQQFPWGSERAGDIDAEAILLAFAEQWKYAERTAERETKVLIESGSGRASADAGGQAGDINGDVSVSGGISGPDPDLPYEKWKRGPLKRELSDRGLDTAGPRAAMAARLHEDDRAGLQ